MRFSPFLLARNIDSIRPAQTRVCDHIRHKLNAGFRIDCFHDWNLLFESLHHSVDNCYFFTTNVIIPRAGIFTPSFKFPTFPRRISSPTSPVVK